MRKLQHPLPLLLWRPSLLVLNLALEIALGVALAYAGESPEALARVSVKAGVYHLYSAVLVEQAPAQVRRVLTDYAQLPRINPGITKVRLLDVSATGAQRMAVEATSCVMLFCRTYRWVQAVRDLDDGTILAVLESPPGDLQSDFRKGLTRYRFLPHDDDCTRLVFEAELEPIFWIPPMVGPWLIERKLIAEALETARSIEAIAAAEPVKSCQPLASQ